MGAMISTVRNGVTHTVNSLLTLKRWTRVQVPQDQRQRQRRRSGEARRPPDGRPRHQRASPSGGRAEDFTRTRNFAC
ncbi:unnamed protein product [Ectocarpus sp. 12 AP-2014]